MNSKMIIFIVGPTAVGKSDVALYLAKDIDGEIISCDSMQVYKEIHIANNKPSKEVLNQVPHHLVDICSIDEEFNVAQFNQSTLKIIQEVHQRNHVPVIVGGSGMYMQILLDGIFESGTRNETLRKDLKEQARRRGNQYLYDQLKKEDPSAAKKIHPNDVRRVIRALEIYITENIPISQRQKDREGLWGEYDITLFGLNRDRQELYNRIDQRVEQMFQEGVVGEVEALKDMSWSQTAEKIIGIQEIQGYLCGDYDLEKTKAMMKLNTRHLAKRQLTWFRREKRIEWIMMDSKDSPQGIARGMMSALKSTV